MVPTVPSKVTRISGSNWVSISMFTSGGMGAVFFLTADIFGFPILVVVVVFIISGFEISVMAVISVMVVVGVSAGSSMVGSMGRISGVGVSVTVVAGAWMVMIFGVGGGSWIQAVFSVFLIQLVPRGVVRNVMRSATELSGRVSSTVSPLLFNRAEAREMCQMAPLIVMRSLVPVKR